MSFSSSKYILYFTIILITTKFFHQQPTSDDVYNQIEELNIEEITQQFRDFDLNNDGYNDAGELRLTMPGINEDQIALIFAQYDLDQDGVLSLEEYLHLYNSKLNEKDSNTGGNTQNEEQL